MSDAGLKDLPAAMRKLKHLRCFDISYNEHIQVLPEFITKLYNLQTLRVYGCTSLEKLLNKIISLVRLRHICFNDKRLMPSKVGDLTNLQTLSIFVVAQEGQTIDELEKLKQLRGYLLVCGLENVRDKGEAERAKLKERKLSKLGLEWTKLGENEVKNICSSREGKHEEVMEGIGAPTDTKELIVESYMGKQFPRWVSELKKMVKLKLKKCRRCETMPTLGHLRNLKILLVERMDGIKVIGSEFYGESNNVDALFPLLEEFFILEMESLVEWVTPMGIEIFPKLCKLHSYHCPKLTGFPWSQSTSSPISMRLGSPRGDGVYSVEILCSRDFKSLHSLEIRACPKLTFLHIDLPSIHSFLFGEYDKYSDFLNLTVCSNKLGESWKFMMMRGVVEKIREFPKSLEALRIEFLCELSVEAFRGLSYLRHLVIRCCDSSESILTLSSLTSLEHLEIEGCHSLESILSVASLKHLEIRDCSSLESISTVSSLISLEYLQINKCGRLQSIPTLSSSTSLKHLEIDGCPRLESIPNISSVKHLELRCLEKLLILGCDNLTSLSSEIKLCTSLKELAVANCGGMVSVDEDVMGHLTQLEKLVWGGFSEVLDQLPGFHLIHHLTSLQRLRIIGWNKLTSLPSQIQRLTSITYLKIWISMDWKACHIGFASFRLFKPFAFFVA